MNPNPSSRNTLSLGLICAMLLLGTRPVLGQWSSIRGNNRDRAGHGEPRREEGVRSGEHAREPVRGREGERPVVREGERPVVREGERPVVREGERAVVRDRPIVREQEQHRIIPERRRWDVDLDRHHSYYWSRYRPGMALNVLPPGYRRMEWRGRPYFFYEGVFYEPGSGGYVVVNPPAGVIIPSLPPGAQAVAVGDTIYYYAGTVFYVQQPNGFLVVPPPLGITVTMLPPDAVPVNVNGILYYVANSVYYLPMIQGGVTVYTVVHP